MIDTRARYGMVHASLRACMQGVVRMGQEINVCPGIVTMDV